MSESILTDVERLSLAYDHVNYMLESSSLDNRRLGISLRSYAEERISTREWNARRYGELRRERDEAIRVKMELGEKYLEARAEVDSIVTRNGELQARVDELEASMVAHFQRDHLEGAGPEIDRWKRRVRELESKIEEWEAGEAPALEQARREGSEVICHRVGIEISKRIGILNATPEVARELQRLFAWLCALPIDPLKLTRCGVYHCDRPMPCPVHYPDPPAPSLKGVLEQKDLLARESQRRFFCTSCNFAWGLHGEDGMCPSGEPRKDHVRKEGE